ncbi:hypothetical protein KK141_21710 [Dyella sp. LX-66]|uniref:HEPN domain-containing protein n=1 Tax=unclassified Dyella TaxID=2634549 RepID=UPI001BE0E893|nr:hypothetical protein [Dyella sp. LX-1]MBT2142178.1 hypothetical protein [Dyella sp. LX-66]
MSTEKPLYAGLSGLELSSDEYDLGNDLLLRKTYAHLMCQRILAFKEPPQPGAAHPGPWLPSSGSDAFNMRTEIVVPESYQHPRLSRFDVAKTIVGLIRIFVNPEVSMIFSSEHPLASFPELDKSGTALKGSVVEVLPRHFGLRLVEPMSMEDLDWVKNNWAAAANLRASSSEFAFAMDVLDIGQFIPSTAMALVSIWGALEAIFSPAMAELKFRVSSMIAAYMEPPGDERLAHQKKIGKLYDMRSAAAHGKPKHGNDDLLASFELLRIVLIKIIERKAVPSKEDLERALFCG